MFARLALLAFAVFAASAASASRQTHELIACVSQQDFSLRCDADNDVRFNVPRLTHLYRDGWRLIAINTHSSSRAPVYFLERPISPQQ
jgi:hypothetical protein